MPGIHEGNPQTPPPQGENPHGLIVPNGLRRPIDRREFLFGTARVTAGLTLASAAGELGRSKTAHAESIEALGEPTPLRELASNIGFEVGVFMTNKRPELLPLAGKEFNSGAIWVGWPYSEPQRGQYDTTTLKVFGNYAQKMGMTERAHMLYWPNDLPAWLKDGDFQPSEMDTIVQRHFEALIVPNQEHLKEIIVVNEPYMPPYRKQDKLYDIMGPRYIEDLFHRVAEMAPNSYLILNDADNHTERGIMTERNKDLIARLKAAGLGDRIKIGLQMHLDGNNPPDKEDVKRTMQSYGVPVVVTEFDVNLKDVQGTEEERFKQQAQIYGDMLEAAIDSDVCKNFTIWGTTDDLSIYVTQPQQPGYSPNAAPLLFNPDLTPKPAYYRMADVLKKYQ